MPRAVVSTSDQRDADDQRDQYIWPSCRHWFRPEVLAAGEFLMTLDSSVMNVSIRQVAADVGTTVALRDALWIVALLAVAAMFFTGLIPAKPTGQHTTDEAGSSPA